MSKLLMIIVPMSLPKRLLKLRKDRSLTQQAMAEAIGIHVNSLKKYEAGQAQPSLEALKKIAITMNVSTDYLLFEEHERGPSEDLVLQFEAISQFDDEDKELAQGLLEGLILKHQAKQSMQRQSATKKVK